MLHHAVLCLQCSLECLQFWLMAALLCIAVHTSKTGNVRRYGHVLWREVYHALKRVLGVKR